MDKKLFLMMFDYFCTIIYCYNMKKLIAIVSIFLCSFQLFAQLPIGEWRDHLPYNRVKMCTETPTRIYGATLNSLFYVDKSDNSINRLSKVNGLSDVGISYIAYSTTQNAMVVAYTNANVDIIKNDVITNISDIKRKPIPGNKVINSIYCDGDFAYLACGFGVVVLDVKRQEIKDTWIVGDQSTYVNILDIELFHQKIYLATPTGILSADKNSTNLANYISWSADTSSIIKQHHISEIERLGDVLIAHIPSGDSSYTYLYNDTVWTPHTFFNDAKKYSIISTKNKLAITYGSGNVITFDSNLVQTRFLYTYNPGFIDSQYAKFDDAGNIWICDNLYGLIWNNKKNEWHSVKYILNGPNIGDIWQVSGCNETIIAIKGAVNDAWNNLYTAAEFSSFSDNTWLQYNGLNNTAIDTLYDIINIAVDPSNNHSFWLGSWGKGLIHVQNSSISEVFDYTNSILGSYFNLNSTNIGGLCFDKKNNLWVVNSNTSKVLNVKTPNNQWYQYSLSPYTNNVGASSIQIDSSGYKWILLPRNNGLLVYDDNGTLANASDDRIKSLNINLGTRVSSNTINCFAQDLNGDMWIGTDKGIKVFYNTESIFNVSNPAPQTILIEQDGYVQNLLEFESVTAIVVDGANRKWIGTSKAGLFVVSADGTTELGHFTEANSPLFSNEITSLAFNQKNGELFIGTKSGLISYKTDATMGTDVIDESQVYAFPNPVKDGYSGVIAIKGLTTNANVKITNVNGSLVYQTIANGGEAIWNGKNFNGERASTGVYLVFASNEDGTEKVVTKILFIK